MANDRTVGWIGVGAMGLPICRNLLKGGCEVVVYDRLPERIGQAMAAGATGADSVRQVAQRCDLLFSMVYDDQAFEAIVSGPDGVLAGLRPGSLYVDMSTVSPRVSAEMAALLARHGVRYLRAPVSGSVGLAETGELTVLVSGDESDHQACLPILQLFSRAQTWQGPGEAARVIKLVVNALLVGSTVLIGEALALGESAGLSRETLVDAINASIVGSRHYAARAEALKHRRYGQAGPLNLVAKDMDLALGLDTGADLELPLLRYAKSRVGAFIEQGQGDVEVTVLAEPTKQGG